MLGDGSCRFYFRLLLICMIPLLGWAEPLQVTIDGEAAILMNAETGVILYEKSAHAKYYPASTTKVATALFALNHFGDSLQMKVIAESESLRSLSDEAKRKLNYKIPGYWLEPDGMHIGIQQGEELTLRELIEGMLIPSACDASNVIAQALGPTIPTFMDRLNAFLKEIGCLNTHFCNPHGLHHPDHLSTAYDLALMSKEALKDPVFCEIVAKTRFSRPKTNKQVAATYLQTNRLIRPGKFYYSKAIGMKTGYHSKAKRTFIGAARFEGRTLIVVLLGYADRNAIFSDAIKLFDAAFNQPKVERSYLKAGRQKFTQQLPHADRLLRTFLNENLSCSYYPAEDPKAKCYLAWDTLELPIRKGQRVGELQLVAADGQLLKKSSLLALDGVKLSWPYNWKANLGAFFDAHPILSSFYLILFAFTSIGSIWWIRRRDHSL